jgi:hypothetical protein
MRKNKETININIAVLRQRDRQTDADTFVKIGNNYSKTEIAMKDRNIFTKKQIHPIFER